MTRKALLGLLLAPVLVATSFQGSYWGTSGYYRSAQLDSKSLKLRVSDRVGLTQPGYRSFFRFTDGRGRHEISDCEPHHNNEPHVCYNLFQVEADDHLSYRTKFLRLLSGPYGNVYGVVTYYYEGQYSKNSLDTMPWMNDLPQILPEVLDHVEGIEKLPLSAISLVRIFRAPPEFLIASANYSSDGHLYELHVNGAKGGTWVHSNELIGPHSGKVGIATMIGDDKKTREFFGFPEKFPVSDYLGGKAQPFSDVKLDGVLDAVNLHYDESRVVRQDVYVATKGRTTSFLNFPQSKEDEALRAIDHERGFADIDYTREKPKR